MISSYICPDCEEEFQWDDSSGDSKIICPRCSYEMDPPAVKFHRDDVVGDYRIIERIGIGGMGEIYLASQISMERPVALKILQEELVSDKAYLDRFFREVRMLARIEHPNVVRAIETGVENSTCYFSMSYIPGKDIKQRLEGGEKFSEMNALIIMRQVALALKYVWEKHQLLHRDIKPANIMLTPENEVKLMDLGISKRVIADTDNTELTLAGMMVGSPLYISPEQAKAKRDVDFRADMYSLGVTLFQMLTGSPPYEGESAMAIIAKHLGDPVPDPRARNPNISRKTSVLIMKMMSKDKEKRYLSWNEAILAMDSALEELDLGIENIQAIDKPIENVSGARKENGGGKRPFLNSFFQNAAVIDNPVKLGLILGLILLCLVGLVLISSSASDNIRRKKARLLYNSAISFLEEHESPMYYPEVLRRLENVQKVGDPYYKSLAIEKMRDLPRLALEYKRRKERNLKNEVLQELRSRSSRLQKEHKFDEAIRLWEDYREKGEFAEDPDFRIEIRRALEFLHRRTEMKRKGLL